MAILNLTRDQWNGILRVENGDFKWLPICCGNLSEARTTLREIHIANGEINMDQAHNLYENAIKHDAIKDAWMGNPCSTFLIADGTPWPEIFKVLREMGFSSI